MVDSSLVGQTLDEITFRKMFLKCGSAQTSYRPIKFIASFDYSNKHSLCCLPATNLTKLSMTLLDGVLSS